MGVKRASACALLVLLVSGPGCFWVTTKHEGEEMQDRIKALEDRTDKAEASDAERSKKLDEALDQATKLLTRNSADLGTQVDKISDELATISGKVEILSRNMDALRGGDAAGQLAAITARLDALERQLGISTKGGTGTAPTVDKATLFGQAQQKLQAGEFAEARRLFRAYVQAFPIDDKADDAQYGIGEAFYKEKDYEHAIAEFQRVIDSYPNGDMIDDAFMEAGTAALENKWCVDSAAYLGELVRRFPQSPFVKSAKQKLDYIAKHKKDAKDCKPG